MNDVNQIIALITAGVSLSMAAVSFYLGRKLGGKTYLVFSAMVFCLFLFIILPPVGFISNQQPPFGGEILFKRIFIYSYYALFPWFIYRYLQQKNAWVPWAITVYVAACYGVMLFSTPAIPAPVFMIPPLLAFAAILVYGLIAGVRQYHHQDKQKVRWFLIALVFFGVLFLQTAFQLLEIGSLMNWANPDFFISIHMHSLVFVWMMGMQMVNEVAEKYQLEKALQVHHKRWQSLMRFAPAFVLELDEKGNIIFINDFGINLLDYPSADELLRQNWFDHFLSPEEAAKSRMRYTQMIHEKKSIPDMVNTIRDRQGNEHVINWVNFLTYSEDHQSFSLMCVGTDMTKEESANQLIQQLRLEVEKEKIVFPEEVSRDVAPEIIGSSETIRYVLEKVKQVAKTNAPVLLEGETGVGKELVADLIHRTSLRSKGPIIKVNCGALPKELIEDELFGHEKGAFTSAIQVRKGRFELADGGTMFLDEIGELPLEMQPKLLRVLQNGEFERIGGQKTIKVDVRIIAATNRELHQEVKQGRFRDDLFYRLNVFPITIPPLRKRKEDITLLINHFIRQVSEIYKKQFVQISKADLHRLAEYTWPGNVRELKNVIERSVIASDGDTLKLSWFLEQSEEAARGTSLEDIERQHILRMLEACQWKINGKEGTAEKLNMNPNTLRSKMKKLGISRPVSDLL
jgi:formate hydrogenlyase transcriptional activator